MKKQLRTTLLATTLILILCAPILAQSDLEVALKSNDAAKLESLLKNGADPNTKNANGDPLVGTAATWPEMVGKFIAAGAKELGLQ
ncbi:MAG: hypothetical protein RIC35_19420 [Marinoscillum sp.]